MILDFVLVTVIVMFCILIAVFLFLDYYIRFTRWRLIDLFRLNRLLGVPRVKDLSREDLNKHFANFVWLYMDKRFVLRNGCKVIEISPLSAKEGHKYVVISKDNRPFQDVCRISIDTDIPGMEVKATVIAKTTKDYENMMNIMGWNIREVLRNLREVDADDKEAKQNIIDRYIEYMMREVL